MFAPQYYDLARTIFNILLVAIFVIVLIAIIAFIISGELLFQIRFTKDVTEHGYSPKLIEMIQKRKKKYENNKYNMNYMQAVVFLANERLLNYDYDSAYKYLEEIDLQEFYDKLKIGTGKAQMMNAYYFYGLIDLWIGYYYENNNPVDNADDLLNRYYKDSIGLYIDKNKIIAGVNDEINVYYSLLKNDINNCENILSSLPGKFSENKVNELLYYKGMIECSLKKKQLTMEFLSKYVSEGKKLADNSKLKVQFYQFYDQYYKHYSSLI